jgi:hypothetical protein
MPFFQFDISDLNCFPNITSFVGMPRNNSTKTFKPPNIFCDKQIPDSSDGKRRVEMYRPLSK